MPLWFVYTHMVCIHAYGAHRDHKRESEAPSEPPNKNAGNWTRVLLTTETWLQTSPFSNIYLILCVFRDTIIFLIICALLNVCDKKSVLCPQSILPAPPCSTSREISQATKRKPLQNMNSGWLKSSFINRILQKRWEEAATAWLIPPQTLLQCWNFSSFPSEDA